MTFRSKAGRAGKVELGSGCVDQIVVGNFDPFHTRGRLLLRNDKRAASLAALRVELDRTGFDERDTLLGVDRDEIEGDLRRGHLSNADPDVGRDPIPHSLRAHHDDFVGTRELLAQDERCRVSRNAGSEYDDAHRCLHGRGRRRKKASSSRSWL
jgi:hypothetical protein